MRILFFLLVGSALTLLTFEFGESIIRVLIPSYEWMVKYFEYRFNDVELTVGDVKGSRHLLINIVLSQPFYAMGELLEPTQPIYNTAGMPLGYVFQPLIFIITLILCWPAKKPITLAYRSILALPLIFLIMMLDMPVQLVFASWLGLYSALGIDAAHNSWFDSWSNFLNGGGLMAISIAAGILTIGLIDFMTKPKHN